MNTTAQILVADIGGTYSRFAQFALTDHGQLSLIVESHLKTPEYPSFRALLNAAAQLDPRLELPNSDLAVLAVPGPVMANSVVSLANVPWDIDLRSSSFARPLYLINDFEAQALGCVAETSEHFKFIKSTHRKLERGFAVVGAGTGLGHCAVKFNQGLAITMPSEAGHASFAFLSDEEWDYQQFLLNRFDGDYPNHDRVVSGSGLALLHEFLTGEILTPPEVAAKIHPESATTIWFARFFARGCKHYILSCLGICDSLFLTGGIAIKNPFLVNNPYFTEEFIRSSTKRAELSTIPIKLVTHEALGLLGCAQFGKQQFSQAIV
jgi:glucokinase